MATFTINEHNRVLVRVYSESYSRMQIVKLMFIHSVVSNYLKSIWKKLSNSDLNSLTKTINRYNYSLSTSHWYTKIMLRIWKPDLKKIKQMSWITFEHMSRIFETYSWPVITRTWHTLNHETCWHNLTKQKNIKRYIYHIKRYFTQWVFLL